MQLAHAVQKTGGGRILREVAGLEVVGDLGGGEVEADYRELLGGKSFRSDFLHDDPRMSFMQHPCNQMRGVPVSACSSQVVEHRRAFTARGGP